MRSAESILLAIQVQQQEHDQRAHRDILNLDTQTRLKHMILHFLKYAGKIVDARERQDTGALQAVLLDTFIICVATANALNVSIGAAIHERGHDLDTLSRKLARDTHGQSIFDYALSDLVRISGAMAKSIESTDHLERGDPRAELERLIVDLSVAILGAVGRLGLPLEAAITQRWSAIEARSIFCDQATTR